MLEFINNFYGSRVLFIVVMIVISFAVVDIMKKKYSIDIKDKINLKTIDFNFLIRIIALSFTIRILIEQTIYFILESAFKFSFNKKGLI